MPSSGAFFASRREIPQPWDCVVVQAVHREPVSAAKFPAFGHLTGIFPPDFGSRFRFLGARFTQ